MNEPTDIEKLRHSLAHLLAAAVLDLYPEAKPTIGPATDNGFYYDFDFGGNAPSESDLKEIEKKMKKILNGWDEFSGKEVSADEARDMFKDNQYKLELIDEIEKAGEAITVYTSVEFTDLCRGGHIDSAQNIDAKAFKLDRIAGAYWRGDENNTMLTRIYGLAFTTPEELKQYEEQLEEAKKRDHRKLGQELDLFTMSELVGGGLPLFTPKGTAMRKAILEKINGIQSKLGYQEVTIPHITKPELYKTSGHWEKFGDELFKVQGMESEFVMKPMNCPHHTQIFASKPRSYRDLPIRYSEPGVVYRDEQSGELLGLSRVRAITQDDGHAFCRPDQIEQEIKNIISVIKEFYTALGMWSDGNYQVFLSTRDPETPDKYLGTDENWNTAEEALRSIASEENLPVTEEQGEAAFYGPKLDFKFKDAIGREWQLGTVQLDFNMPERFGLEYTDSDGEKKRPVMIHRAIAGSLERFMSVAIEHFAGNFPFWLSPVQVKVLPIAEAHTEYAQEILEALKEEGFRAEIDLSNDSFGKKVRNAKTEKVPCFLVIGDEEMGNKKITLESRDSGQLGQFSLEELLGKMK